MSNGNQYTTSNSSYGQGLGMRGGNVPSQQITHSSSQGYVPNRFQDRNQSSIELSESSVPPHSSERNKPNYHNQGRTLQQNSSQRQGIASIISNASFGQERSHGQYGSYSQEAASWQSYQPLVDPMIGAPPTQTARADTTGNGIASAMYPPRSRSPPIDYNSRREENSKVLSVHSTVVKGIFGIQGFNNSCYMDSCLVSLFLYDKSFQECILRVGQSTTNEKYRAIRDILSKQISLKLNQEKVLEERYGVMRQFRAEMAKANQRYFRDQQDPEEFISTLFGTILGSRPFYRIAGESDGGYVFQTYGIPSERTKKEGTSIQKLVEYSFKDSEISLGKIPRPGFIIKLPVTDGKHMFPKVFPNLRLSLEKILKLDEEDKTQTQSNGKGITMGLSAVICLCNNHFTAFVRMDPNEMDVHSPWVYLDSFNHSEYTLISNLSQLLEKEGEEIVQDPLLEILMRNPYMCVYLPIT